MDDAKLRAWWSHRQGLDGRLGGQTAAAVLEQTGWVRSVGGSAPYLSLFARCGIAREDVDAAVASLEIHELPSARGCTYILPASDFALGLKVGQAFNAGEMNVARKLGVTDEEVKQLCDAVVKALEKSSLSPEELRESTGEPLAILETKARRTE
jgi:Winged helix DNA-binding domain